MYIIYKYTNILINYKMAEKKLILTSVKIQEDLFDQFKIECVRRKFSFQKLADRAVYLYLTDEEFRRKITNQNNTEL
jgi:hypothetical protein